jgi:hypothetical protein
MAPEGPVVIPQMMVGVARVATDGQFCFLSHACFVGAHAPGGAIKNKKAVP